MTKRDYRLLTDLQHHVMTRLDAEQQARDVLHIHPSEMAKAGWCPRSTYFRIVGENLDEDSEDDPRFSREAIFAEGHSVHRKYQTWLWEMGELWGKWACRYCEHAWPDKAPTTCPACGAGVDFIEYREVPLFDHEHRVLGHADGAYKDALIEIKTVGLGTLRIESPSLHRQFLDEKWDLQTLWDKVRRPFPSHLRQGQIYMHCTGFPEIIYLYECKWNQQVKEFVVKYNPSVVAPLLEGATEVVRGLKSGFPPLRPTDATSVDCSFCKECKYKTECWGVTNAANTEQEEQATRTIVRRSKGKGSASR
jgi:CRISPR/Cas system-associated exonuclease Cas4 (RecB family)